MVFDLALHICMLGYVDVPFLSLFSTRNIDWTSRDREKTCQVCPAFGSLDMQAAFSKKLYFEFMEDNNREVLPQCNVLNMTGQILTISSLFDTDIK